MGRPRDRGVDHAIVRATRELLQEAGYAALTVDAVARRAGVGKAAIYRRYATQQGDGVQRRGARPEPERATGHRFLAG